MAAGEIARLFVSVGADTSDAEQGLSRVDSKVNSTGRSLGAAGALMSASITAPLLLVGKSAVSAAADYEQNMKLVQVATGASGEQMGELQDKAKALGADMSLPGTSAADAATAMLELGKAGLSVNDILGASKGVLQLSAAGQISNAQAAEIAANALNAFHLEGTQATTVADQLAATANASSADVTDLAQGFQMAAAVFASGGQDVTSLNTALGEMANNGIKGADAGTSLKQMLLALEAPTDKAASLMQTIGLNVYDAQGHMKPMRDIIGNLSQSLSSMTDSQRNAALATIFGSDAVRAANVLLKEGTAGWDTMQAAVTKQGAAGEMAAAQMTGLKGAFAGLQSTVETMLLNAVLPLLGTGAQFVRFIADLVGRFDTLSPSIKNAALAFVGVLAAAGPLMLAVTGIGMALGFILSPIGLIVLALAALSAAWVANAGGIRDQLMPVFLQFGAFITGTVLPMLQQFAGWFMAVAVPAIGQFAAAAVTFITGTIIPAFQQFVAAVLPILEQFGTFLLATVLPAVVTFAQQAIQWVQGSLLPAIQGFINAALPILQQFAAWFVNTALPQIEQFITRFMAGWDQIEQQLFPTLDAILGYVRTVLEAITGFVQEHGDRIQAILSGAWTIISAVVSGAMSILKDVILGTMALIRGDWSGAWAAVRDIVSVEWDTMQTVISTIWGGIRTLIEGGLDTLKGIWQSGWDGFKGVVSDAWEGVKGAVSDGIGAVESLVQSLPGRITGALGDLGSLLVNAGQQVIQGLIDGITSKLGALGGTLGGVTSFIAEHKGPIDKDRRLLHPAGQAIMGGLMAGIQSQTGQLGAVLGGVTDSIRGAFGGAWGFAAGMAKTITPIKMGIDPLSGKPFAGILAMDAPKMAGEVDWGTQGGGTIMRFANEAAANAFAAAHTYAERAAYEAQVTGRGAAIAATAAGGPMPGEFSPPAAALNDANAPSVTVNVSLQAYLDATQIAARLEQQVETIMGNRLARRENF